MSPTYRYIQANSHTVTVVKIKITVHFNIIIESLFVLKRMTRTSTKMNEDSVDKDKTNFEEPELGLIPPQ